MDSDQTTAVEMQRTNSDKAEVGEGEIQEKKKKKKKKKEKKSKKSNEEELITSTANRGKSPASDATEDKEFESTSNEHKSMENGEVQDKAQNSDEPMGNNDYDDEEVVSQDSKVEDCKFDQGNGNYYNADSNYEDERKVFLSRIPSTFDEDSITRIFQNAFGENCIHQIALCIKREEDIDNNKGEYNTSEKTQNFSTDGDQDSTYPHRGFGFITMSSVDVCNQAIAKGTVRGTAKEASKRKHTMYIRPIARSNEEGGEKTALNVCFLWSNYRCPYGDSCKFNHIGEGGCLQNNKEKDPASRLKKQKCFSFRTKGKCKWGDDCPYSHDIKVKSSSDVKECTKIPQDKDCINWKSKGKCRKGDKCPYRHDESVLEAFLTRKNKKKKRGRSDNPQPLSVRVFGLNYDTKEEDIREYFQHCGHIREITFPTFEDSGRSKGYCGVLFTSPKATEKATEMDGSSLHGRWLSIQSGKMYLKQWEEMEQERVKEKNNNVSLVGEFGQKVKKRKKHGFKSHE